MNEHYIALEFDKVLDNLSKYTSCELSNFACRSTPVYSDRSKIQYELNLTTDAKKIIDDTQTSIPIDNIYDVDLIFKENYFSSLDIINLAKNLTTSRLVKSFLLKNNSKDLISIAENIYTNKPLEDEISGIFDSDMTLKDTASDTLKSLRNSYKDNRQNLQSAINKLLQDSSFVSHLQDTLITSRDSRPCFQVKASDKNKVQGIVHDISQTNLTYFIEPSSIVPLSNKLRQIEIEIQAEIDRILRVLSEKFKAISSELKRNQEILIKLDCIFARAKYSIHLKAAPAELYDEKLVDIQAMRHPLLVEYVDKVVENDIKLGYDHGIILITGSNTGGKTVALKTLGLMVLMTRAGLHIPCLGAKIYPYEIYCDISKEQSLEQGFSTYSIHIKNISDILNTIDENSLVLLDELGSGTDPEEGAALSKSILYYIKEKNSHAVATTHLGELKSLKYEDDYFENATVLFNIETMKPEYKLITGMSGTSCAIDISDLIGLNPEITKRAREFLKHKKTNAGEFFDKIERTNQELIQKEQELEKSLKSAQTSAKEADEKLKDLNKNKKKSLENFKKKFQGELERARSEIKDIVDEIRKEKSIKVAARAYNRLSNIENQIREDFSNTDDEISEKYKHLNPQNLKIGQSVLIKKLNQVVILDSLPDKKGEVYVKIGNIRSKIELSRLAYTDKKVAQHLKKVQFSFDHDEGLLSRIDLRGMRVDEALDYLDKNLDKANLKGLNQVTVIHGFGTGALKKAVSDYLKNSPYVSKYRYEENSQGKNEGSTIVDLM